MARAGVLAAIVLLALAFGPPHASAQESGWRIDRFLARIEIQRDGSLIVREHIDVTFDQERRGIIRDIPVRYEYDETHDRIYELEVLSVQEGTESGAFDGGDAHPYIIDSESPVYSIRIGDPDVFLTGPVSYVITYEVNGAINTFDDRHELYWNVTGPWPVPIGEALAQVTLTGGGLTQAQCYQGPLGSTEPCYSAAVPDSAAFAVSELGVDEQLTAVTAIEPGAISQPALFLVERSEAADPAEQVRDFLGISPGTIAVSIAIFVGGLALLIALWWREGRDRVYTTLYYLTNDPAERTRPPFARREIVVEYTPPERLRPALMGVLLDEEADDRDLTATIIDLAVRGHLSITQTQEDGLFRDPDWRLDKKEHAADPLAPFEKSIYDGLFDDGRASVEVSGIKPARYGESLRRAQKQLYDATVRQRWFPSHPDKVRGRWQGIGSAMLALGALGVWLLGSRFELGVLGIPVAALGVPVLLAAGAMPRRTAHGSEMLRRVLGFRLYIETAEASRAEFAEKANLFTEYLPYAIVFGSVDKWAKVFEGIDISEQTKGWYSGGDLRGLTSGAFSSQLLGLSSGIGSAVRAAAASTPGGSGASGFSFGGGGGGFSGGGGGGGGGRSW